MYKPIIPWIGGKRRLADKILPKLPMHTCYAEPFAGAAAILFAKEPADCEVLNDVNGELVNLYRIVKNHLEEFVRQFKWALTSRQMFEWEQMKRPETLTDIQRAARFYYLQKLAFGGRVEGQNFGTATTSGPRLNLLRIEEELSMAHLRLANVWVENLDWQQLIKRYDRPHTVFYCDPPYWQTEGYGVEFGYDNYLAMNSLANSIQGSMVISINDHPEIRTAFESLHCEEIEITYTVGGSKNSQAAKELIYWNDNCEKASKPGQSLDLFAE